MMRMLQNQDTIQCTRYVPMCCALQNGRRTACRLTLLTGPGADGLKKVTGFDFDTVIANTDEVALSAIAALKAQRAA